MTNLCSNYVYSNYIMYLENITFNILYCPHAEAYKIENIKYQRLCLGVHNDFKIHNVLQFCFQVEAHDVHIA